jgi:hypothetical protein
MSVAEVASYPVELDPAAVANMDSHARDIRLVSAAIQAARGDLAATAYAVAHLPGDDPYVRTLERDVVADFLTDKTTRLTVMAQVARQTNSHELWTQALQGVETDLDNHDEGSASAAFQGVTVSAYDRYTIDDLFTVADMFAKPHEFARALRATARQCAHLADAADRAGDAQLRDGHLRELGYAHKRLLERGTPEAVHAADEVQLDLIEFHASRTDKNDIFAIWNLNGKHHQTGMKDWGRLKIYKHDSASPHDYDALVRDLLTNWSSFTLENRLEIIQDMTEVGRYDDARELAHRMPEGLGNHRVLGVARLVMYTCIARDQADTDLSGALQALEDDRTFSLHQLEAYIGLAASLPDGAMHQVAQDRILETQTSADTLTRHEIALIATTDPQAALARLTGLSSYGYEPIAPTLNDARIIVARALARGGHIEDAIRLANQVSDSPDPVFRKSYLYADIAHAARRAAGAHK